MMSKIRWQAPSVTAAMAVTDSSSARHTAPVASPSPQQPACRHPHPVEGHRRVADAGIYGHDLDRLHR